MKILQNSGSVRSLPCREHALIEIVDMNPFQCKIPKAAMTAAPTMPEALSVQRSGSLATLAALLLAGGTAIAADAQIQPQDTLAEIIVTAQKREQNLQDVGTSIAVLSARKYTARDDGHYVHRAAGTGSRNGPVLAGRD